MMICAIKLKRSIIILLLFLIVTSGLFALFILKKNDLVEVKSVQIELSKTLIHLEENEMLLRKEIEKLEDPDYVANLARQDYYLSKEDEYIFKVK